MNDNTAIMIENLELKIIHFLELSAKPFCIDDIIQAENLPDTAEVREQLLSVITSRRLAFYDAVSGKFLSRAAAFSGAVFSIAPTQQEIMDGILYIGHRCMPFLNPEIYPHQMHFLHNHAVIDTKIIPVQPEQVYPYYYLFGEEFVPHFLAFDNPSNNEAYLESDFEEPAEISVTVLDMAQIYWNLHMEPGDRFAVTVIDWQRGIVELTHIPAANVNTEAAARWKQDMKQSFLDMFREIGPGSSMEEQVLYAFFSGLRKLLPCTFCSFEEFMQETPDIDIVPFGVESRFWETGKAISITGEWNLLQPSAPRSDVEDLFWRFGYSLPEYVIEAYIRDGLYQRNLSPEELLRKLLGDTELPDYVSRLIFFQMDAIYRRIKAGYNWFADQDRGPLRARLVALHSAIGAFVHRLDREELEIDDLPQTPFIILSQLMFHVSSVLDTFDSMKELSDFDRDSLDMSLNGMEEAFFEVKTQILDSFEVSRKKRFLVVNADGVQHNGVFLRLEFPAAKTEVPSVREIAVPADWTLARLYPVVCAAAGLSPEPHFSFDDSENAYVSPDMTLDCLMTGGASDNFLTLHGYAIPDITVTLKTSYTGNKLLPFCEYTFGRNAVRKPPETDAGQIFAFPGTEPSSPRNVPAAETPVFSDDGEIPSIEEVTAMVQRAIRTDKLQK